ncbi:MAG TPA: 16S rRNA (adenine(1518)-N(6)/adenine(1519)-N(6))-dimethyltransferase RsmA [Candidatus Eisenbacteria bacterium]|nr:16S rRNA (adenine(1518)-N(6)/adenine(1519)-N(6))-dimethyltransferase RsmA [Candidatus Eisenbacteria bacterium]
MGVRRDARDALAASGLRPRKRWGQHFLCDPGVARRIVETAGIGPGSAVLEIGPGLGALTGALAERAARLYLVEIDPGLAVRLEERYADRPQVRVVAGDVLELPLATLVREPEVTVVANLPYNITTPILFRLLALRERFPRAVVMVQREVATRLAAKPGGRDWGVLPALVQTFAEVRVAFGVSRRSFLPPPRVESAVVDVRWSLAPRVDVGDLETYRQVVRAAFGQRRKTLRNALGALATARGLDARALTAAFATAGIDPATRAERLSTADFARLARAFEG